MENMKEPVIEMGGEVANKKVKKGVIIGTVVAACVAVGAWFRKKFKKQKNVVEVTPESISDENIFKNLNDEEIK